MLSWEIDFYIPTINYCIFLRLTYRKSAVTFGFWVKIWTGLPSNEIGYSNKVLELIKHMYSVDHK